MKLIKSLPQKEDFFSFFAPLIKPLKVSSYFAQLISFCTEIGIVYAQSFKRLSEILDSSTAKAISLIIALFVGLTIEIGLRKLLPILSRQLVNKKIHGDYLAMLIPIILASLLLTFSSGFLSFNNSFDLVEEIQPPIVEINKNEFEESYNKERGETLSQYSSDNYSTAQQFAGRIETTKNAFNSQIEAQSNNITIYQNNIKKRFYVLRNEKAITTAQQKITALEIERDKDLNEIETQKSEALALLLSDKKEALKEAKNDKKNDLGKAQKEREEKLQKQEQKTAKYGGLLAWFTIVCLFILILAIVVEELFKRGSQIEERVFVSPYYFENSILGELLNELSNFSNYWLRLFLSKISNLTPQPEAPKNPPTLYDLKNLKQERIELSEESFKPRQSSLEQQKDEDILSRLIERIKGELSNENKEILNPILEALGKTNNLYDIRESEKKGGSQSRSIELEITNLNQQQNEVNKEELKLAIKGAKSSLATYKANKRNKKGTAKNNNEKINYWSEIINSLEYKLSLA
jgi:hypothetical protein